MRSPFLPLLFFLAFPCLLPPGAVGGTGSGFPAVVEKVEAGSVMIEARSRKASRFGSGFFLESPEVVVTAYHVIEGARRIRVAIPGTFLTSDALLVSASPEWDIAVLRVSWPEEVGFPGLVLSREGEDLPVGTEVAYTGYGLGTDKTFLKVLSTYRGIISSRVPHGDGHLYHLSGLVNRGLSGCALYLPESGEVVGVITRHFGPEGFGMGFGGAAPARVVRRLVEGVLQ
jgi:S1-C subfamily serine protease